MLTRRGLALCGRGIVLLLLLPPSLSAQAASTLRSADVRVEIRSAEACDVTMRLTVDGGGAIDHRIAASGDTQIDLSAIRGARQLQAVRAIGRTRSLVLETGAVEYELAYSVRRVAPPDRCPLWVPAAPADGVSRAVRITVVLPPGMSSSRSTMPAFTWADSTGTATLGHIPAFVLVPVGPSGESSPWDIVTAMDALTVLVFVTATGIWIWRRKG